MFSALPLVLALSVASLSPAPREAALAVRLADAAARFEEGTFSGEYLRTTRTEILSLSGAVLGLEEETVRVRVKNGLMAQELVRSLEAGHDVTDERRKSWSPVPPAAEPGGAFSLPSKGAALVFSPLPLSAGECGASFGPAVAGAALSSGRLAWDCSTLTPLWAEMTPTDAPAELSEPRVRLEFARAGELLYARRYALEGVVADGATSVKMRVVLELSDLKPAD